MRGLAWFLLRKTVHYCGNAAAPDKGRGLTRFKVGRLERMAGHHAEALAAYHAFLTEMELEKALTTYRSIGGCRVIGTELSAPLMPPASRGAVRAL